MIVNILSFIGYLLFLPTNILLRSISIIYKDWTSTTINLPVPPTSSTNKNCAICNTPGQYACSSSWNNGVISFKDPVPKGTLSNLSIFLFLSDLLDQQKYLPTSILFAYYAIVILGALLLSASAKVFGVWTGQIYPFVITGTLAGITVGSSSPPAASSSSFCDACSPAAYLETDNWYQAGWYENILFNPLLLFFFQFYLVVFVSYSNIVPFFFFVGLDTSMDKTIPSK